MLEERVQRAVELVCLVVGAVIVTLVVAAILNGCVPTILAHDACGAGFDPKALVSGMYCRPDQSVPDHDADAGTPP